MGRAARVQRCVVESPESDFPLSLRNRGRVRLYSTLVHCDVEIWTITLWHVYLFLKFLVY